MAYSQSMQSISYQVQTIGGVKKYVYNGRTFNSEQEVMAEIQRQYPGYTLKTFGNTYQGNGYQRNNYPGNNYQGNSLQNIYQNRNSYNQNNQPGNSISNDILPPVQKNPYQPSYPSPYKPSYPSPYKPSYPSPNSIPSSYKPSYNPQNNHIEQNTMSPWLDKNRYIDNNKVSAQIWRHVWKDCHYPCFSSKNYQELKLRMLKESNQYRRLHSAPPLVMDAYISNVAQTYAQYIAKIRSLVHDNNRQYGENLGMATASVGYIIVKQWYDEMLRWNFRSANPISGTGHFTQLVWTASQKVGFGVAESNGMIFVVAKYEPKGNIIGHFSRFVLPLNRNPNAIN